MIELDNFLNYDGEYEDGDDCEFDPTSNRCQFCDDYETCSGEIEEYEVYE